MKDVRSIIVLAQLGCKPPESVPFSRQLMSLRRSIECPKEQLDRVLRF